jgi:hypothetical protein
MFWRIGARAQGAAVSILSRPVVKLRTCRGVGPAGVLSSEEHSPQPQKGYIRFK